MKIKNFFKYLIYFGLPFGIYTGYRYGGEYGALEGIEFGSFMGIALGTMFSVTVIIFQSNYVQKKTSKFKSYIKRNQKIELRCNFETTYFRCIDSLNKSGAIIITKNVEIGHIHAQMEMTIWSFGENINIFITQKDDVVCVDISSEPTVKTTLLDYGKNKRNINNLVKLLHRAD